MMRIGEVSNILGVCSDRLKRLEAAGLFTPQRDCVRYAPQDVERLRAILYPHSGHIAATVAEPTTAVALAAAGA